MTEDVDNERVDDSEATAWSPAKGGVVMKIEFDRKILNELKNLSVKDGVGSIYQMIRNACYSYVEYRTGKKFGKNNKSHRRLSSDVADKSENRNDAASKEKGKRGIFGLFK